MLIFLWNAETKEYLRTQKAQTNPKRPNEYLMPANSTTEQIPDISFNQVIVWNGEHWTIKNDYRGQYMVNHEMIPEIVRNFGELPDGYVLISKNQIKTLEERGSNYFIIVDGKLVKNPDYIKEQEEKEQKRISHLNMTKYDFFKYVCKPNNITYQELMQFVNSNDDIAAAWNLCERVYRGDELLANAVKQVIPTITDETLTTIFEKYGSA